jgi:hypothetical protein
MYFADQIEKISLNGYQHGYQKDERLREGEGEGEGEKAGRTLSLPRLESFARGLAATSQNHVGRAQSRRCQQREPAVAVSGGEEIKTQWVTLFLSRTCKRGSNQASARRRARIGAGLAARPASRPSPRSQKASGDDCGGGDDSGGCALNLAIRFGPASRSRRARIGAGLAAPPPALRPGPGRRKGGGDDGGGGRRPHRSHPIRPGLPKPTRPDRGGARSCAAGPAARPGPSEERRRRRRGRTEEGFKSSWIARG